MSNVWKKYLFANLVTCYTVLKVCHEVILYIISSSSSQQNPIAEHSDGDMDISKSKDIVNHMSFTGMLPFDYHMRT